MLVILLGRAEIPEILLYDTVVCPKDREYQDDEMQHICKRYTAYRVIPMESGLRPMESGPMESEV